MKINNILIVYSKFKINYQKQTINEIKRVLNKYGIRYKFIERTTLNKSNYKNIDLIMPVGGDGTFLKASQFLFDKRPIYGVNSNPLKKEGFFMESAKKDFEKKLKKILQGVYKIRKLHRLEAYINNKKIKDLALNEFYVASEKPYVTARYYLNIKGKREKQKSSGILISTAAGSHAWIKSAGGKSFPIESDKFEYLIREPYCGRVSAKCALFNQILDKNEKIEVIFEVGNGIIIADSLSKPYKFNAGQKVVIKMSKKPLHSISF
tara:strand:- start:565 stop:1356 length:792 start_codon:yes stop_codon:yes gene_type:complete